MFISPLCRLFIAYFGRRNHNFLWEIKTVHYFTPNIVYPVLGSILVILYIVLFNEVYMPLMLGRKQKLRHRNIMVNLFNKHLGTFGSILNIYHLDHIQRFQSVPSSGKKIPREYET